MCKKIDYSISGDFGKVILAPYYPNSYGNLTKLDSVDACGYHYVNSLYHMVHENGIGNFLIIYTVSGKGEANIGGKYLSLTAETVFIIPPKVYAEYKAPKGEEWEFYWLDTNGVNVRNILSPITQNSATLYLADTKIADKIAKLITPNCENSEKAIYAAKIISQILFHIISAVHNKYSSNTKSQDIVDNVIELLEQIDTDTVNLKEIADTHYISVTHLIRLFHEKVGDTPYHYHRNYRLSKAAQQLIYSDKLIKKIALDLGYKSANAFSVQFTKRYGISPMEYRNRNKHYQN